jgi:hypothetical protein
MNKKKINGKEDNKSSRKLDGWPAWGLQSEQILDSIRAHVFHPGAIGTVALGQSSVLKGDNSNDIVFADFLQIFDVLLSQLIRWVEQKEMGELHKWAGKALAERLQFLLAQQQDWCLENQRFAERWSLDRRHVRPPRSYLGWLAGDYLRALIVERRVAGLLLMPPLGAADEDNPATVAELLNYPEKRISWLRRLRALPDFSRDSAPKWADVVFDRMRQDEQKILATPDMRNRKTRESTKRRRNGKVRLGDLKRTVTKAVMSMASKAAGTIRGITRPT